MTKAPADDERKCRGVLEFAIPSPAGAPPSRETLLWRFDSLEGQQHKISSIRPIAGAESDDRKQESNLLDFFFLVLSFFAQARPGFGSKGISISE
jgi:hypothetical protein